MTIRSPRIPVAFLRRPLRNQAGGVPAVFVHVLLLLLVLGQIVYLASRHRKRWDLTSDQLWSLTDSTRNLVARLDKQLLIEAYFSPKEKLPVTHREVRSVLDNFLDELVQRFTLTDAMEFRARRLVEGLALALQGSLLLRHAPQLVADAFCATRLGGAGGRQFGTLPAGIDALAIVERSLPG